MGAYTQESVPAIIKATQAYHVNTQGWIDIAYNFSIDRFGRIWEGRGQNKYNAASGDTYANSSYTAVELLIGMGDPFTVDIQRGFREFQNRYLASGGSILVQGHRDVVATACPGDEIYAFIKSPAVPPTQKVVTEMPHYILHLVDTGSYYGVYDDGMVQTHLFWNEIEFLMSKGVEVCQVLGPSVMATSRFI